MIVGIFGNPFFWKYFLTNIVHKCIKSNPAPWINSNIKKLMRLRDFYKKRAKRYISRVHWDKYKSERNKINSEMKRSKTVYYQTKIKQVSLAKDMKKTSTLINNLIGKGGKLSNIAEININENVKSDPKHIAETIIQYYCPILNLHF